MKSENNMITCSKCVLENMAIVNCVECDSIMCATCLLGHQLDEQTRMHQLAALKTNGSSDDAGEEEIRSNSGEMNNKTIDSVTDLSQESNQEAEKESREQDSGTDEDSTTSGADQQDANNSNSRLSEIENSIERTFQFYTQMLNERKEYLLKELSTIVNYAQTSHAQNVSKKLEIQCQLESRKLNLEKEIHSSYELYTKYNEQLRNLSEAKEQDEMNNNEEASNISPFMNIDLIRGLTFKLEQEIKHKLTLLKELNSLIGINNALIVQCQSLNPVQCIEFTSNYSAIQTSIRNTFGFIRINKQKQPSPSSVNQELNILCDQAKDTASNFQQHSNNSLTTSSCSSAAVSSLNSPVSTIRNNKLTNIDNNGGFLSTSAECFIPSSSSTNSSPETGVVDSGIDSAGHTLADYRSVKHPLSYLYANFINNNPKLNSFNYNYQSQSLQQDEANLYGGSSSINKMLGDSGSGGKSMSQFPLNRSKMIYHCKFGEFGITDGQFTEPSGVTINTNNDIIVADTNSHRIQIFDKEGVFKFKFGECGKRDGQLLYPNRVSIVAATGDIVVTERSPTHQIQIYSKYGAFLRKFGANILQHPRGVYVDYKSRIVVVECKVMRVIIFDLYGNVLNKFNCSKYLEFPNGVCCSNPNNPNSNQREEIYISDNRAHCIKVFDYNGNYLRLIGGEGITNYPIGVGINAANEILVADNHNNFNLTVFSQDGKLINALESKVKHAQCFDVCLMDNGSIVLASKDYRIYVYKYGSQQSLPASSSSSTTDLFTSGDNNSNNNNFLFSPTSSVVSSSSRSASLESARSSTGSNGSGEISTLGGSSLSLSSYDLFSSNSSFLNLLDSAVVDDNRTPMSHAQQASVFNFCESDTEATPSQQSRLVSFLNSFI